MLDDPFSSDESETSETNPGNQTQGIKPSDSKLCDEVDATYEDHHTAMKDRHRLNLKFNAAQLQEDLSRLQGAEWIAHFVTQNYDGDWSVIPLRGPAGATHPVMMIYSDPACTEFADTPFLANTPHFRSVRLTVHYKL